jgi:hypothetical protein
MNTRKFVPVVALVAILAGVPLTASAKRPDPPSGRTPNSCVQLNSGDWSACNVGNNSRGDLTYRPRSSR